MHGGGAVRCGAVWWWCGAVRHPSIGQGRQYQSLSGTSPGHSRGTGVTSGTPEHSVGQSSATQQHDKTTQTTGYVNQQSVYCSMKAFCVPTPHTCIIPYCGPLCAQFVSLNGSKITHKVPPKQRRHRRN